MKKNILKFALIVVVILLSTSNVFSQTMPPPNDIPNPGGLPIDGGIIALVAVAFGYGVKKIKSKN